MQGRQACGLKGDVLFTNVGFCDVCKQPLKAASLQCSGCGKLVDSPDMSTTNVPSTPRRRKARAAMMPLVGPHWAMLCIIAISVLMIAVLVAGLAGML
jgi:hypothetical protein